MFQLQVILSFALSAVLFGVKVFALVDCVGRKSAAFARADTLAKPVWLAILAVAILFDLRFVVFGGEFVLGDPINLLGLAGTLAALVYLAQLRGSGY